MREVLRLGNWDLALDLVIGLGNIIYGTPIGITLIHPDSPSSLGLCEIDMYFTVNDLC